MGDDSAQVVVAESDNGTREEEGGGAGPWEDADSSDGETVRILGRASLYACSAARAGAVVERRILSGAEHRGG